MNLLIVDDEEQILEGIVRGVLWEQLTFEHVWTAKSFSEAVDVFGKYTVDVLLSDIEMDSQNGLDLIQWVNEHSPETGCLILSCHEEFNFARRAVALKCLDYILKPVPYETLTEILKETAGKVERERSHSRFEDYGKAYVAQMGREATAEEPPDVIETATAYINAHLSEELPVEFVAKLVHVSPRHLGRLFQKAFGKSVLEYMTGQRMLMAGELLRMGLSITMTADRVGYSNYSYFIKQFKKFHGSTPRDYQQDCLKNGGNTNGSN